MENLSEKTIDSLLKKYKLLNSENEFHRLSLEYEDRALRRVREGRYRDVSVIPYENIKDHLGATAKNPKRAFEYNVVAAITLYTRAAIDGGVPPEEAFDLSDVLLQETEKTTTIEELYNLYRTSAVLFAKLVSNMRKSRSNYQVEQCRVYVLKNIFKRITVKEIAEHIGLTPNYLSTLFREHEGIGLCDYIQREKISLAGNLLSQSTQPISFIALYLGFKSQSNFIEVFKKWQGMTPSEYRNLHFRTIFETDSNS